MSLFPPAAAGALAGAATSLLVVAFLQRNARRFGLIDAPNERSSHVAPTPRGGGLGIVAGTCIGVTVSGASDESAAVGALLSGALLVAALGLWDDVRSLSPTVRLIGQTGAATLVVLMVGPMRTWPLPNPLRWPIEEQILGGMLSVLWIVAVTNFFNFMDGIDGLAGGQAVASCIGVALSGWSDEAMTVAGVTGAASLGFLRFNWAPARIFMGDVGSGFLGFILAGLPWLSDAPRRGDAILAVGIGLALFLLDPAETLLRRAKAGKRLSQAHREHRYQQLIAPGRSAARVSAVLTSAGLALAVLGAIAYRTPSLAWYGIGAAIVLFVVELLVARSLRRNAERGGVEGKETLKEKRWGQ